MYCICSYVSCHYFRSSTVSYNRDKHLPTFITLQMQTSISNIFKNVNIRHLHLFYGSMRNPSLIKVPMSNRLRTKLARSIDGKTHGFFLDMCPRGRWNEYVIFRTDGKANHHRWTTASSPQSLLHLLLLQNHRRVDSAEHSQTTVI